MASKVGNKRWLIIFILVLCYTFMYLGRSSISIAGSTIMKDYGWSATQFGLVSTAFFIGYAITMLPAGYLADKFGAGKVIVVGTLVWSLFTLLSPFAGSIGIFVAIRAMVGVGQGVTFLPLLQWYRSGCQVRRQEEHKDLRLSVFRSVLRSQCLLVSILSSTLTGKRSFIYSQSLVRFGA